MQFTWKKVLLLGALFLVFIVMPLVLGSTFMMKRYQAWIDAEPNTGFHRWLQLASADVCHHTMRPELAAQYYRRFMDRYRDDERRPYACLRYAQALEDSGRSADALGAFQKYMADYPEREDKKEAAAGIDRITYHEVPR